MATGIVYMRVQVHNDSVYMETQKDYMLLVLLKNAYSRPINAPTCPTVCYSHNDLCQAP